MKDLSEGHVFKLLISFSIPMIVGNLFQAAYSIIDGVFVGRILGHVALAAVSISTPLIFFLVAILIGLGIAAVVLVGQAYGAKNHELLSRILVNSFTLNVSVSVLITLSIIIWGRGMLALINTPEGLMEDAYLFLSWFASGFIFMVVNNWIMGVMRGLGDSRTPMYMTGLTVLLNILFIPFLIKGAGPIPPLGVRGSALSTVLANMVTTAVSYVYLARKNHVLDFGRWRWVFDRDIIAKIIKLGLPTSLQMLIVSFSGIVLMGLVNLFGDAVIAAYGIGLRVENFSVLPAMSIGVAVSTMVAQSIGAGKIERAREITVAATRFTLAVSAAVIVVCTFLPEWISIIFTNEAAVISHAALYLRIMCWAYLNLSLFFILQSTVRGAGSVTVPLVFSILTMSARIAFAYALSRHTPLNETGIWIGIFISTLVGLGLMFVYYQKGSWHRKKIIETGPVPPLAGIPEEDIL
ncbi:MAG TPA: MATE family efflux transporter [Spirochaetota bacterium]|nr:MATE family efflux transporter [Spirochaetota bacterium]HPC40920.1 MATE family efflux transporter [Spirochaetota bacterium]HPL16047.1 MATE family efflux transporter [Spirochaetota bacterium]HQF08650.1 MATE family efflux transporter [Spirochaetota bacterium]HQH97365.1 MATE family efflux transporter [Spirochaetota bacterium]